MKKDKNLEDLFREKLVNYEQTPPSYILNNVLDAVAGARRKRMIVFWKVAGVAAALFLAFVAGWQINTRSELSVEPTVLFNQQPVSVKPSPAKPMIAASETTIQSKKENNQLAILTIEDQIGKIPVKSISNPEKISLVDDSRRIISNEESALLRPIKSLFRLLDHGNSVYARNLQNITPASAEIDASAKTIDQQIMEQNQQAMLSENKAKGKSRWLLGAQVSPEYNISRSSHSQVYASNMLNASANSVDLGGGITVEYKKGKRWSLQSGVYYSGMGQTSGNSSLSAGNNHALSSTNRGSEYFNTNVSFDAGNSKMLMNSTAGVIEFKGIPSGIELGANLEDKAMTSNAVVVSDARFIQNFEYLEIPLYLKYTLIDSKIDIDMMGGFSSNVLVGNQTFMESSAGKNLIGSTKDMESMSYSGTLGLGLKYGLSKRVSINVEPRIKYFLNSLNSNTAVNYKPYTIGVFTGLSYEF